MKLSIEFTTEEIKNTLQAICGSEERGGSGTEDKTWSLRLFFGGIQVGVIPIQLDSKLIHSGEPLNDKGSDSKGNI